jgi:hypothetical protein
MLANRMDLEAGAVPSLHLKGSMREYNVQAECPMSESAIYRERPRRPSDMGSRTSVSKWLAVT